MWNSGAACQYIKSPNKFTLKTGIKRLDEIRLLEGEVQDSTMCRRKLTQVQKPKKSLKPDTKKPGPPEAHYTKVRACPKPEKSRPATSLVNTQWAIFEPKPAGNLLIAWFWLISDQCEMGIHTFMHTQFEIPNVDPEKKIAFWWQIWLFWKLCHVSNKD